MRLSCVLIAREAARPPRGLREAARPSTRDAASMDLGCVLIAREAARPRGDSGRYKTF